MRLYLVLLRVYAPAETSCCAECVRVAATASRHRRWMGCRCHPTNEWRPFSSRHGVSVYEHALSAERQAKVHATRTRRETRVVYFDHEHLPTWTSDADVAAVEQEGAMLRAGELAKAAEAGQAPRSASPPKPKRRRSRAAEVSL